MVPNFLVLLACAFIPFIVAFAWFHPKAFGGETWKSVANLTNEQNNQAVKPYKLGLSILLNLFIVFGMYAFAVHASGVIGAVGGDMELASTGTAKAFLDEYAHLSLNFRHGAIHGLIASIVYVLPILGYSAIFERKGMKYLLVNWGFWAISLILIGGVLCQWGTKMI